MTSWVVLPKTVQLSIKDISIDVKAVFFKPGSHIPSTYLRRSRRLQLTTVDDLFQWRKY